MSAQDNLKETIIEAGWEPLQGRFYPKIVWNSGLQTVSGTVTGTVSSQTPIATVTVEAGQAILVTKVSITNEGTSGSASYLLGTGIPNQPFIPYYLPSPGESDDTGTLGEPIMVFFNASDAPVTFGIYITSGTAGTYRAAFNYFTPPTGIIPPM